MEKTRTMSNPLGTERIGKLMVLSLLRQIIVLVPTVVILGAVGDVTTVLWAGPISDTVACIASLIALVLSWKKVFHKEEHVR